MNKTHHKLIANLWILAFLLIISCAQDYSRYKKEKDSVLPPNSATFLLKQNDSTFLNKGEYATSKNLDLINGYGNLKFETHSDSLYLKDWNGIVLSDNVMIYVKKINRTVVKNQNMVFRLIFYKNRLVTIDYHLKDAYEINEYPEFADKDSYMNILFNMYGKHKDYRLIEITEDNFILEDDKYFKNDLINSWELLKTDLCTFNYFEKTTLNQSKGYSNKNFPRTDFEKYDFLDRIFKWEGNEVGLILKGRNQYNLSQDKYNPEYKHEISKIHSTLYRIDNLNLLLNDLNEILNNQEILIQKKIDSAKVDRNQQKLKESFKKF